MGKEDADSPADNSNWMGQLPSKMKAKPLTQFAIPGSHDSLTYKLYPDLGIANDEPNWLRRLDSSVIRKVVLNWSVTQMWTLTEQLTAGIRYLDIRISVPDREPDTFRVLHGLYGIKVEQALSELVEFLKSHPTEVVILDMNHFYNFDNAAHSRLQDRIVSLCGGFMASPMTHASDLTLDSLISNKKQIIACYHGPENSQFWNGATIQSPWPNTDNLTDLFEFLGNGLNDRKGDLLDVFYVTQGLRTETARDIIMRPLGSLRKSIALPTTEALVPWLGRLSADEKENVNIVIADCVDAASFIPSLLALNSLP